MKQISQRIRNLIIIGSLSLLCGISLWAQTDSRYDAGLNLPFNEQAGDVNPQTGNITLQYTDLALPGRGWL